jgi:phosphatidate phosphatase PAH1
VFTEQKVRAELGEIAEPERCNSPAKKTRPTM